MSPEWEERLQTAIPEAYDRVIDAALSHDVDFVVFSGDIFDSSHPSYCDYLRFFDGLDKLDAAGIPSYLITGNHDPYTTWVRDVGRLPASAHMMGVGVPTFELYERDGEPLCLIGGRGYYGQAWPIDESISEGITRSNAVGALSGEHPRAAEAPFAIGVIHTGLNIDASKAASDEATLLAQDIDYWACGHLHRHFVRPIIDDPRIVFPGCIQGRDIKESGERGCYLVELSEGISPRIEFVPTASVAFHSLDVDISACLTLPEVENTVKKALFLENGHDYCSEMVAHVNLVGETDLHGFLRQPDVIADMRKHINDSCPGFFCDAIVDYTRFVIDPAGAHCPVFAADESNSALINHVQSTLVQHRIAVPDALARRMDDFRSAAETLVMDLTCEKGDALCVADASAEVERRIAGYTGHRSANERSIYQLGDKLEAVFVEVRKADEASAALRQEDRELRELEAERIATAARLSSLADEVEDLQTWCHELKDTDAELASCRLELEGIASDETELDAHLDAGPHVDERLLSLSVQDERALRDKLDDLSQRQEKAQRAIDDARERVESSSAAYEALAKMGEDEAFAAGRGARTAQIVVSALLPTAFMVAGIWVFAHGRSIGSLSFTAFGMSLVVLAFFLAAAAIVLLFRPKKGAEALEARRKDAHWIMLQDQLLLDARLADSAKLDQELEELFDETGLQSAGGSIRQASLLLDDAQTERSCIAEREQRAMALEMHRRAIEQKASANEAVRRRIEEQAGLDRDAPLRTLEATLRLRQSEHGEAQARSDAVSQRVRELSGELERARADRSFDQIKLDYHQLRARLRAAKHDYIVLLLAQRILEKA